MIIPVSARFTFFSYFHMEMLLIHTIKTIDENEKVIQISGTIFGENIT